MHRLIYASRFTSRFPLEREDQDYALNAIIRSSTRNNRAADVTGLLLTHRRMALQVLEGSQEALGATYERIQKDPRHEGARLIAFGPVPAREFGDWGLLTLRVAAGDSALVDALDGRHQDFTDLSPADALALLAQVRDIQARNLLAALA
jgi:hypothetical protein